MAFSDLLKAFKKTFSKGMGRLLLSEVSESAGRCNVQKALQLIADGALLDKRDIIFGSTALIEAAEKGHTIIVSSLIAAGAKLNDKDIFGSTALIYAARNGHQRIVTALIAAGASLDEKDKWGNTALLVALRMEHADIASVLIKAGAALEKRDNDGHTALSRAGEKGYVSIVQLIESRKKAPQQAFQP